MRQQVYVTGMGIISAIGLNIAENLQALRSSKSGIGEFKYLETRHKGILPVGEVKLDNKQLVDIAHPERTGQTVRTLLLGMIAIREAISEAGLGENGKLKDSQRTALISGTTVGGMDRSENFFKTYLTDPKKGALHDIIHHDPGAIADLMALELGFNEVVSTVSTACSSGANAIMLGARMIRQGLIDRAVVGGIDAMTRFTLNGFNSLMILDQNPCKPFDANRQGLNLGEGAGFIVLESAQAVKGREAHILCQLKGYGNANDAHHQTASSPKGVGAFMAMDTALKVAQLTPEDISYINAHGTGTRNNDQSEGIAVQRLFKENIPPISSTKAYTGHTLGAAGAIEAVFSILSVKHQIIFPNLNFSAPIPELNFAPETNLLEGIPVKNVLSNSFGFGGNCTSLVFGV